MPVIGLDADGVLLDYHAAYRQAWKRVFGYLPNLREPRAYWPIDRWEVRHLEGNELHKFRSFFDDDFWTSMPAISGAVTACKDLSDSGYDLVCVSALDAHFQSARLKNLRNCGFPIERVIATPVDASIGVNPKAEVLRELRPVAFVDDFLPYFRDISTEIHSALVLGEPIGSPNAGEDMALAQSQHADLAEFASWWLSRMSASR